MNTAHTESFSRSSSRRLLSLVASQAVAPDLALGALFGIGGFCGMYIGARLQRFIKANIIRIGLGILIAGLALKYTIGFFPG